MFIELNGIDERKRKRKGERNKEGKRGSGREIQSTGWKFCMSPLQPDSKFKWRRKERSTQLIYLL
jgi:hypothetical protein